MEQNIDEIIAAFDQAYQRPERKNGNNKITINNSGKKKKKNKRKNDANEVMTERITFSSPTNSVLTSPQQTPKVNMEHTHILTSSPKFFSVGSSISIGKRKYQQDAIALSNNDYENPCTSNSVYGVLSDGMGGMQGGEKASAICTSRMMQLFQQIDINDFPYFIEKCLDLIDQEIADLTNESGESLGAGATMISFIIVDNMLYWSSVGDSHIYVINKNGIKRLNREHNYMMRLMSKVEDGEITIEQAQQHKQKDALISFMGMNGLDLIDLSETPVILESGDVVLACSDGMYRMLSDSEIENTVRSGINDIPLLANILVNRVLEKQYKFQDNISVILAKKM